MSTNISSEVSRGLPLDGKKVVVIGGRRGIGAGIAEEAKLAGAAVVVGARQPVSGSEAERDSGYSYLQIDISQPDVIREALNSLGAFDHIVVPASPDFGSWGTFMDDDIRGAASFVNAKLLGSWACARYAIPHLRDGGSITFMTGAMAGRPRSGFAAVSSTFAAVEALSKALALELAPVRVNTIRPGFIDTEMWSFLSEEARQGQRQKVRDTFPVRRVGVPADVGQAAVYLMTNSFVTGTILEVTGGENLVPQF
jgi:NAD(P)-dependent dehydrogenase (short-subunit alcohol dehydrogenase family)